MDIVVKTAQGERIDVEMQVRRQEFLPNRSLYYGARQLVDALNEGEDFDRLKKCVVIGIVAAQMFEGTEQFHHIFRPMVIQRKVELTDTLELQYLELSKLDLSKPVSDMTEIEMAESVRIKVSEDERLRVKAMLEEKYQLDRLTEINQAKRKGLEEGEKLGKEKGSFNTLLEMADKMQERGIDPETIREITGLDLAKLGELSGKKGT